MEDEEVCDKLDFEMPDFNVDVCFNILDVTESSKLNLREFKQLCFALFRKNHRKKYLTRHDDVKRIFHSFDKDSDGFLDRNEFQCCWDDWIQVVLYPRAALVVVDVQNDFISGSLVLTPPEHLLPIVTNINRLIENVPFDLICYAIDWHPIDHVSFIDNVGLRTVHDHSEIKTADAKVFDTVIFKCTTHNIKQKLWPKHCVADTPGAAFHPDLIIAPNSVLIRKGTKPDLDAYSAFYDNIKHGETELNATLLSKKISDVYVCGIAVDYCVGFTMLDSLSLGYRTIMVEDCSARTTGQESSAICSEFQRRGGYIITSNEVPDIVAGMDRRPELAFAKL